ncbi:MAG: TIR domain-containing protein [Acidobacteria bacterium]|nr:TIR domain-containing protein [Acidobacteriota bacterium]
MADLFLSYAREDRECAEQLAQALSARGWSVWWDRRIQVGKSFSEIIEHEIADARCVVVIWSRHSVESEWVQNEAAEAAHRKVLVPIRIEDVRMPLEFRRLQTADLFDWRNGFQGRELEECLLSIENLIGRTAVRPIQMPHATAPAPHPAALPEPVPPPVRASYTPPPSVNVTASAPPAPGGQIPNYLIASVLVTLLCCLPTGIVAIIAAADVNTRLSRGDVAGAMAASARAKRWCWISVAVGLGVGVVAFILSFLAGMARNF